MADLDYSLDDLVEDVEDVVEAIIDALTSVNNTWSIVNESNSKAVSFTSILEVSVSSESQVSTCPIEEGSFAAYNKIVAPIQITMKVAVNGTKSELDTAIDKVKDLATGTELVNVITPEQEYEGYNIYKYAYRRAAEEGTDLIVFDLSLIEIKEVESEYTNTTLSKRSSGTKQASETSLASMGLSLFS